LYSPKLRWLEDAENGSGELKMKIWSQYANNREERVSVEEEEKILRGP
jgi:hypothetical protein